MTNNSNNSNARLQVTCRYVDEKDNTTHYGFSNDTKRSVAESVHLCLSGTHLFVKHRGKVVSVKVAEKADPKYLYTEHNGKPLDNLKSLRICSDGPKRSLGRLATWVASRF